MIGFVGLSDSSPDQGPTAVARFGDSPQVESEQFGISGQATLTFESRQNPTGSWHYTALVNGCVIETGASSSPATAIEIQTSRNSDSAVPFGEVGYDNFVFEPVCSTDVNNDTVVNILDLMLLLENWGPCPEPCTTPCPADVIRSGHVDVFDLLDLLSTWCDCLQEAPPP
jgi:hypothetical protein